MQKISLETLTAEAEFNSFHGRILLWSFIILVLDGYDLAVVGAVMPTLMEAMQIDATSAGMMASAVLVGTMMGAIFLGTLADRIGRPRMIAVCIAVFSLFTAASGLTNDPISFSIVRFIAGLGIGGVVPIVTAQMAEFAPVRLRARLVTIVFAGYSIGGIIVALTVKQIAQAYGWQSVFYVAALPVVLIPLVLKSMPESMAFLAKHGRKRELLEVARKTAPHLNIADDAEIVIAGGDKAQSAPVRRLFQDGRGLSTVMIWLAFMTGLFMVYALNSWLTKLMAMAGYSLGSALNFVIVFNVGAMLGAVFGGWLGDRLGIRRVLIIFYILGALSLTMLAYSKSTALLFASVFIVGATTLGTQLLAYAYAGDYYPASIRSTGVGFATGVGRIGAIVAPVLIGWLVALNLPLEQNFMAIGIAGIIGAVAVMLVNERSHAKNTG